MKDLKLKLIAGLSIVVIALSITIFVLSCTKNDRVFTRGGTMIIVLESHEKLVNITWKNANIWILTRPMRDNETPERYEFNERSRYGFLEGKIVIKETVADTRPRL